MVGLVATLEKLVAAIADVEGIDAERVRAIARAMREADLIATRGRGKSAAPMSERDAANLLIAVNVADTARTAPWAFRCLTASGWKTLAITSSEVISLGCFIFFGMVSYGN